MVTQEVGEDYAHTVRHDGRCGVGGSQLMGGQSPHRQEPDAATEMSTDNLGQVEQTVSLGKNPALQIEI